MAFPPNTETVTAINDTTTNTQRLFESLLGTTHVEGEISVSVSIGLRIQTFVGACFSKVVEEYLEDLRPPLEARRMEDVIPIFFGRQGICAELKQCFHGGCLAGQDGVNQGCLASRADGFERGGIGLDGRRDGGGIVLLDALKDGSVAGGAGYRKLYRRDKHHDEE